MSPGEAGPISQGFGPDERHIGAARTFVRDAIERLGLHPVEDLDLLTSEVVGNAVEHAVTSEIVVRVGGTHQGARVEVHDQDPARPEPRPAQLGTPGGLGLRLVAALSTDWGVDELQNDGKVVWFEVELPGRRAPG